MRETETRKRIEEKISREIGPEIKQHLNDPNTIEIMLNPDGSLWVDVLAQGMKRVGSMQSSTAEALICSVASYRDMQINSESPILECEFPLDGSRFEALLPPVVTGPAFSLRKHAVKQVSLAQYTEESIITPKQRGHLEDAISSRKNILIVGGTGSGKTTFANAILRTMSEISPDHRLVVIEDTREIKCASENTVFLRTTTTVTQRSLLRATLRLRPDRIIVGEVRGGEALDLLKAWNTGHGGGLCTVHANNALASLSRLEQLIAEVSEHHMPHLIAEAIDLVVVIARTPLSRKVTELVEISGFVNEKYDLKPLE